mmetsp:Transcript_9804/g.19919  ORF Transcript_9804/g.19919 Transcript_9804/m.19919 type:complete len:491 (-) Transcript_9804:2215-3687(-)
MPPFLSPSSGRSSRYRRRIVPPSSSSPEQHTPIYSSSAVAAAELAASSIVSDTTKNTNAAVPKLSSSSTVIQNLRASRARLMQRNNYQDREQRWFKLKLMCFGVMFVIGLLWIGKGGAAKSGEKQNYSTQDQRNLNHYDNKQQGSSSTNDANNNSPKLSVPLPPNRKGSGHQEQLSNFRHKKHSENKQPPRVRSVANNDNHNAKNKESLLNTAVTANNVQHQHVIPPILTFTYHTNLLTTPHSQLTDSEDVALSQNVQEITSLHPESKVRFLNDDDCLKSIQATLGMDTNLTKYFKSETHGMYKADICRGAALYETGGLYFDIDVETRSIPLWEVIAPTTEFVTTLVHKDSNHLGGFFQAFFGVVPKHPMMKRYLELFVEYYEGKVQVKGPLGVYFLRMAYDEVVSQEDQDQKTELWQEVRYSPEEFPEIHRDRWGKRRACQMMVVAPPKIILVDGFERKKRMVPIFSHANGSRMCGGKDTNRKGNSDTA